MWSILIVEAQPGRQCGAALFGRRVGHCISPFALQGLNEALRFAVGLRAIGSGAFGGNAEPPTGFAERSRAIGAAVVGEHPLNADAAALERTAGPLPGAL